MKAFLKSCLWAVYQFVLSLLNLGERRCGWCSKFMGFKRGMRGQQTHGMCAACAATWNEGLLALEAQKMKEKQERQRQNRQRRARRTLRRTTGGWSGAVATR